ncbi:hypothetical protein [Kordiimonas aquimaris]|uniref:hypothetical protein n=1 Tax=Kordiimonas aquimaris TaxID=707591 RepID=UPI0021CF7EB7|nr:hypothetical protein [Kordiimonas aquimaris]
MRLLMLLTVVFSIGTAHALAQSEVETHDNQILKSQNGRFVFGQISRFRRDQYMLDTHTGRLWQIVEDKQKQTYLSEVSYQVWGGAFTSIPTDAQTDKSIRNMLI